MSLGPQVWMTVMAAVIAVTTLAGCGHSEGKASNAGASATVTLGEAATETTSTESSIVPAAASETASSESSTSSANKSSDEKPSAPTSPDSTASANAGTLETARTFNVEGPESAIRISFDDVDLLKVMNLDPVPADAPERLPKWLKALDGKRIRVRGFMYPPFQDTDIRGFVLARDNQICCFGRTPKE